jgi:hypothetical protein
VAAAVDQSAGRRPHNRLCITFTQKNLRRGLTSVVWVKAYMLLPAKGASIRRTEALDDLLGYSRTDGSAALRGPASCLP